MTLNLRGAAAVLAIAAMASPALADKAIPTATEWDTDHGHLSMKFSADHSKIDAVWQIVKGDTGKLHLELKNGVYYGYWEADKYFQTCKLSRDFTFYWGNISVIFDSDKGIMVAKDDFCGKIKDAKLEVWKGVAQKSAVTTPPVTNGPTDTGPSGPVTAPTNIVRPEIKKLGPL